MKKYFKLMRVHHYIKNVLILLIFNKCPIPQIMAINSILEIMLIITLAPLFTTATSLVKSILG